MIAVSVAPKSARLATLEVAAAAASGDLVELRLDRLHQAPDFAALFAQKRCPVIVSCRRSLEGGHWQGTEETRLDLLTEAIDAGADYVELELDSATRLPRRGAVKRIISFTAQQPSEKLDECRSRMNRADPDVIRLAVATATLEDAWPLLGMLARQDVPTVGVGLGQAGLMVALLGARFGAPWTYAALDAASQTYAGQPTLEELVDIYRSPSIEPATPLVGLTEVSSLQRATAGALNAAFAHLGLKLRCLPLVLAELATVARAVEAFSLAGLIVGPSQRSQIVELLDRGELLPPVFPPVALPRDDALAEILDDCAAAANLSRQADLVLAPDGQWTCHDTPWRSVVDAIATTLARRGTPERPLEGRRVLVWGATQLAGSIARGIARQGGIAAIVSDDRARADAVARSFGCSTIAGEQVARGSCDAIIAVDPVPEPGTPRWDVASVLSAETVVADISRLPHQTELSRAAWARGSTVLDPMDVLLGQMNLYVRTFAGQQVAAEQLLPALSELEPAADEAPQAAPLPARRATEPIEGIAAPVTRALLAEAIDQPAPATSATAGVELPYLPDSRSEVVLPDSISLAPDQSSDRQPTHVHVEPPSDSGTFAVEAAPPAPPPPSKWWIVRVGGVVINWVRLLYVLVVTAAIVSGSVWLAARIWEALKSAGDAGSGG